MEPVKDRNGRSIDDWTDEELRKEFPDFRGSWVHLRKLLKGRDSWNAWREENPAIEPDLASVDLRGRDERPPWPLFAEADISGFPVWQANLAGADLEGALLQRARLDFANLVAADLEDANLTLVRLPYAMLAGANLTGAHLTQGQAQAALAVGARLENAELGMADLSDADLGVAVLTEADLLGADLQRTNLGGADFTRANLARAQLEGAQLHKTRFDEADLRVLRTQDLHLDDSFIHRARFAPRSLDPWSVVRRAYSLPAFCLHLLLLIVVLWSFVATFLRDGQFDYWQLPFLLFLHTLVRVPLTWWVFRLRDTEERSGTSPRMKEYFPVYRLHRYFLRWVSLVIGLGVLYLVLRWLAMPLEF